MSDKVLILESSNFFRIKIRLNCAFAEMLAIVQCHCVSFSVFIFVNNFYKILPDKNSKHARQTENTMDLSKSWRRFFKSNVVKLYYTNFSSWSTRKKTDKTHLCALVCGLEFHWYLRTLNLKFQNARTKIRITVLYYTVMSTQKYPLVIVS